MTGRELIAWSARHDQRARTWWSGSTVSTIVGAAAIAGWVAWRGSDAESASHAWLAAAIVAFAIALLRVPFHVYWRADASLLAQLPIGGDALFDAALWRAMRSAAGTTVAAIVGAAPLAAYSPALVETHVALALGLGLGAAFLLPAVAAGAAALVAYGKADELAAALGGEFRAPPTAYLGALPGLASAGLILLAIFLRGWLIVGPSIDGLAVLGGVGAGSIVAALAARAAAPRFMALVLRDVSALDRQRLANLDIHPPTGVERAIGGRLGAAAALSYAKDARLMRRRYPMAFALGALLLLVLVFVAIARPVDPLPWLIAMFAGATAYAIALAGRLRRAPIELPRLAAALPIEPAARTRGKLAWLVSWWVIFVGLPGLLAAAVQANALPGLIALAAATVVVIVAGARRLD